MWKIDRFELAYFDGKKNKWQLFGECPETETETKHTNDIYSYHRTLVQELLSLIRTEFETVVTQKDYSSNFTMKGNSSVNTTIKLDSRELGNIKDTIGPYSETILDILDEEGLADTSKKEIKEFLNKLSINTSTFTYFEYPFTKANYIYDLISLLPIEKDWDVMGIPYVSSPAYKIDEEVLFFKINYKCDSNGNYEKSNAILGYPVGLELIIGKKYYEYNDFFDYCCHGIENDLSKVKQYKTYGCIVDSLQKAIYGQEGGAASDCYIVSYPIFILNTLHYIHIYFSPCNEGSRLSTLQKDWLPVHNNLNWSSLRQTVKYLLEQVSVFTFQDRMLYIIRHPEKYNLNLLDDKSIKDRFKDNIACILPDKENTENTISQGKFNIQDNLDSIEIGYSIPPWWESQSGILPKYQIKLVGSHQWRWLQYTVDELREIIKHGSIAAMTAIIARNLSHNIGSHVLSRWIVALNELLEKGKKLEDITRTNYNERVNLVGQDKFIRLVSGVYESLERSKPLFQYIQHRMDFIAAVATSIPSSEMTMDFKNDILKPFKKQAGQPAEQNVLLENIAASEGFDNVTFDDDMKIPKDCERVSIPNGVIGSHAIYSILENFIRNAAKHYKGDYKCKELKIGIELKIPDRVKLQGKSKNRINDKVEFRGSVLVIKKNNNGETFILTKKEQDEIKGFFKDESDKETLDIFFNIHERYIKLKIWDMRDGSCNNETLENLRKFSDRNSDEGRLIDEKGIINPGGWGIKEMIVSSNFLRKNSPEKLVGDIDKNEPSLMEIICNDDLDEIACKNEQKGCHRNDGYKDRLGIRLYLRRPKDMCIISKTEVLITKDKFGIEYSDQEGSPMTEDIPHRLLFIKESFKKYYEDEPRAPMRIMTHKENINEIVDDNFYLEKYEGFIKELGGYNPNGKLPIVSYGGGEKEGFFNNTDNSLFGKYLKKDPFEPSEYASSTIGNLPFFYYHANEAGEGETVKKLIENKKYFQPVSGKFTSVTNKLRTLPEDATYQRHFLLELIESFLTKVIIIDERVSDLADKTAFHDKSVRGILGNMRINCLKVDKEDITYDSIKSKLKEIGAVNSQRNCIRDRNLSNYKYHFLVIHQGILDKVEKNNGNSTKLIEMINHRWMVIDSGRGVPPELGAFPDARFVETSVLLKMLEEYDKHGLVQTLFSLRRPLINNKYNSKGEGDDG